MIKARSMKWDRLGSSNSVTGGCFAGEIFCFLASADEKPNILREIIGFEKNKSTEKSYRNISVNGKVYAYGYDNGCLLDPVADEFLYNELTVNETLNFHNAMRVDYFDNRANIYRLLSVIKLDLFKDVMVKDLSPDQRRLLTIAIDIIIGSDCIIYEDIAVGLTSMQTIQVLTILRKLVKEYNPQLFIILGVSKLSLEELHYIDRIQVISNNITNNSNDTNNNNNNTSNDINYPVSLNKVNNNEEDEDNDVIGEEHINMTSIYFGTTALVTSYVYNTFLSTNTNNTNSDINNTSKTFIDIHKNVAVPGSGVTLHSIIPITVTLFESSTFQQYIFIYQNNIKLSNTTTIDIEQGLSMYNSNNNNTNTTNNKLIYSSTNNNMNTITETLLPSSPSNMYPNSSTTTCNTTNNIIKLTWHYHECVDITYINYIYRLYIQLYYCFWRSFTVRIRNFESALTIWVFAG